MGKWVSFLVYSEVNEMEDDRSLTMLFFQGIAAIGVFTVCYVWAMESVSGRWKTFIGMTMSYAWPISRYEKIYRPREANLELGILV